MARHIIQGYCNPPIPAKQLTTWRHVAQPGEWIKVGKIPQ